jgi:hypothetical protein
MDSLSKSLYSVVSQAVDEFSQLVATKYGVPKQEILDLWNDNVSDEVKSKEDTSKKQVKRSTRSKVQKSDSHIECDTSSSMCEYEFKKGKNIGTTCTAKSSDSKYCRKHKTQEDKDSSNVVKKEKKSPVETTASKNKKAAIKEKETVVVKKLNEGKQHLVLVRNKYDNYEHAETHFVFDKSTKEVYGRQVESIVEPLTTEDIELCSKYNFKSCLPKTLTSKEDDVAEEEEEHDVEEEEEEEEDDVEEEEEDDVEE